MGKPDNLRRRAILLDIGGFRPPEDPKTSWFGKVAFGGRNEVWPNRNGKPLAPLAQLNLAELPFRPPRLDDIAFLTVFVDEEDPPGGTPNGGGWLLRTYRDASLLVPLRMPDFKPQLKAFPLRPRILEKDSRDGADGFKLGGRPRLLQGELSFTDDASAPEYVFQIDSTEKGCWQWGDGGVGYFGRGTRPGGTDVWAMEMQCL